MLHYQFSGCTGEADAHELPSIPWQDARPCAFEAVLDSNLFDTLPWLGHFVVIMFIVEIG
jgi:hypothetical protein